MKRLLKGLNTLLQEDNSTCEHLTKSENVFASGFVEHVKEDLIDINKTFFRIGFRLDEAQRYGYYKALGYKSIDECAESLFGFKRTTTYDLIKIFNTFCDERRSMTIPKQWEGFNKSKLLLLSQPLHSDIAKICSPSDTYERIKYAMKLHCDCGYYWRSDFRGVSLEKYISLLEEHKSQISAPTIKTENETVDLSVITDDERLIQGENKTDAYKEFFSRTISSFCLARKYVVEKHDLINHTCCDVPLSKFIGELFDYFAENPISTPQK